MQPPRRAGCTPISAVSILDLVSSVDTTNGEASLWVCFYPGPLHGTCHPGNRERSGQRPAAVPREQSTGRPGQGTPGEGVLGFSRRDLCLSSFALNYLVVSLVESRLILGFCFDPCSLLAGPIALVEGAQDGVGGRRSRPAPSSLEPSMGTETVEDDVEISKPVSKFAVLEPRRACRELGALPGKSAGDFSCKGADPFSQALVF